MKGTRKYQRGKEARSGLVFLGSLNIFVSCSLLQIAR